LSRQWSSGLEKQVKTTDQEFLLLLWGGLVVEAPGLDDPVVDVRLVTVVHGFLHTLLRDEMKDEHGLRLPDTLDKILSLQIGMGIPGRNKA
jgi:hypothetical protein